MKVEIKRRIGKRWKKIEMADLIGKSITSFIAESNSPTVAAIYVDDKPQIFMSNDKETVEMYKEKGLSLDVADFLDLVSTDVAPSLLVKIFPNSTLAKIEVM